MAQKKLAKPWHKVAEVKPPEDGFYLCYDPTLEDKDPEEELENPVGQAFWLSDAQAFVMPSFNKIGEMEIFDNITHWSELPDGPGQD